MVAKEMLQMKRCNVDYYTFCSLGLKEGRIPLSCLAAQITKRKENRFIVLIRFRFRFSLPYSRVVLKLGISFIFS